MRREKADGAEASDEGSGAPAARRTIASLSATDAVADALEAADAEERRTADHAASGTCDFHPGVWQVLVPYHNT